MPLGCYKPSLSVIIPTYNGAETLHDFFSALERQSIQPDEILVVDSSSIDKTVEICRFYGATVHPIEKMSFDHGGTRTEFAKTARGDILVFFTQDAILAKRDAIEQLIAPLLSDEKIACSYGRQLPAKDAHPIAAHLRIFNYPEKSCVRDFQSKTQLGIKTIFISNSFAAYKKNSLAEVDYFKNGLIFGEDTCTLGRLLRVGYAVAYVAEAEVYHSHNYSIVQEFKRSFDIGVLHSTEKWLLDTYGYAEGVGARYLRSVFSMIIRERHFSIIPDFLARSISKIVGYKLGRSFVRLPSSLQMMFSMNKQWWQMKIESLKSA